MNRLGKVSLKTLFPIRFRSLRSSWIDLFTFHLYFFATLFILKKYACKANSHYPRSSISENTRRSERKLYFIVYQKLIQSVKHIRSYTIMRYSSISKVISTVDQKVDGLLSHQFIHSIVQILPCGNREASPFEKHLSGSSWKHFSLDWNLFGHDVVNLKNYSI